MLTPNVINTSPPLCSYTLTAAKGIASSIKILITPCEIAFPTSSPNVGIYIFAIISLFFARKYTKYHSKNTNPLILDHNPHHLATNRLLARRHKKRPLKMCAARKYMGNCYGCDLFFGISTPTLPTCSHPAAENTALGKVVGSESEPISCTNITTYFQSSQKMWQIASPSCFFATNCTILG